MMLIPTTDDPFEHYFYKQAQHADELVALGSSPAACILATSSLDALAEIWLHDFPKVEEKFNKEFGGKIPSSIRLARLLKQFIPNDPHVSKVAVVCFAEDWKHYRPQDSYIADQLLSKRINQDPIFAGHELPRAYLDKSRDELAKECPELAASSGLLALAEEYEYGALLYTLYRCSLVHVGTNSKRTHGFARGEEIMYYWSFDSSGKVTIGFGPNLITRWLRNVVSGYVQACHQAGIIPADNINAGINQEDRFKRFWNKLK